jgi:hypothetical protein
MKDMVYERFQKKLNEVMEIPPQTVGPFTPYYKMLTKRLKIMPIPILIVVSVICICFLFLIFGSGITFITSMLQRGF